MSGQPRGPWRTLCLVSLLPAVVRAEPPASGTAASHRGAAAPAAAQAVTAEESDAAEATTARRAAADASPARVPIYQGVSLGSDRPPPQAVRPGARNDPPRVTWIGYQRRDGVPTVFVQLSRPVAWSVSEAPDRLVYTLVGAAIPLANNRRPLDLKEFATPIRSVEARRKGHDVEVTVRLAHKARPGAGSEAGAPSHHERTEEGPGGYKFLVVELPGG